MLGVSIFTFLGIYLLLPKSYEIFLENQVSNAVSEIYDSSTSNNYLDIYNTIDKLEKDTNLKIKIFDENTHIIYPIFLHEAPLINENILKDNTYTNTIIDDQIRHIEDGAQEHNIIGDVHSFEYEGITYFYLISASMSTISNIQLAILDLIPVSLLIILLISMLLSYYYSNASVQPIRQLQQKAIAISNLDFDNGIKVDTDDELGLLSMHLDDMSLKLQEALYHLENDLNQVEQREMQRRNNLAILSHEMKTPLTIVKGLLECMIANIGIYKDHDTYLRECNDMISEVEISINEFLEATKLDTFDSQIKLEKTDLEPIIDKYIDKMSMLIEQKNINISIRLDKFAPLIDIEVFEPAIKNIVENAIKYADANSTIYFYYKQDKLIVENNYNKAGSLNTHTLFKPFERGEKSRNSQTGGHGLGLHIVKKIVDIHGYDVKMQTSSDKVLMIINFTKK